MARTKSDIYDDLLVVRCRRGDDGAWDELVRRYNNRLWYYMRRLVDDDDRAAQLLQDVWVHVLRGLGGLRQPDRLAPWLYTIARRTVMSDYRQRYVDKERIEDTPVEDVVDDDPAALVQFENAELVHFGLKQIGWAEREVLTLYFLEDLSIGEIGRVLEIPPGTVKSRLSRARTELRRVLNRQTRATEK
jgi:RNA polymerase sigma-70 factor (ECF subfamily)